jgi:meso-butanediol dehydrogenase/(S,S)-butanediol dehydrogenase/diacetyl reductase
MRGLKEKKVLVTGGASGIGAATVQRFIEEGSRVMVLDINPDANEAIFNQHPELEAIITADVSKESEVEMAFEQLDHYWGGLDVLINNAGISQRHSILEIQMEDWRRIIDVNLTGIFIIAQKAAKRMTRDKSGVIINMASTNGMFGYPYYADYNASKAGVIELTRSMALELAPDVRVNAVCPGYVMTPMQRAEYSAQMIEEVNSKIPLRRHAEPAEIAGLFAYLASEEAAFITGQCFVIDGGETAGGLASR